VAFLRWGRWLAIPAVAGLGWWMGSASGAVGPSQPDLGPPAFVGYAANAEHNPAYPSPTASPWRRAWTVDTPGALQQAALAGGVIYVGGDGGTRASNGVYAIDAKSGRMLWHRSLANMVMTTPVVAEGMVFVGLGNQQFSAADQAKVQHLKTRGIVRGTGANAWMALDAATGAVLWTRPTRGEDMPTPVYAHGVLYTVNGSGDVVAYWAKTGTPLWSLRIPSYVSMSSPVLVGDSMIFAGAHPYRLYSVNLAQHRLNWRAKVPGAFAGADDCSVAVGGGRIYLEATTGTQRHPKATAYAYALSTGRLLWKTTLGGGGLVRDIEVGAPTVIGRTVYLGSAITHRLYALDAATGKVRWAFPAAGPISASPVVAGGRVYVGDGAGLLYALDARTGRLVDSLDLGGPMAADFPILVGETLYQPEENGQLAAVPLTPGGFVHSGGLPPLPSGPAQRAVMQGVQLFQDAGWSPRHLACSSCHLAGGTRAAVRDGVLVPSLVGAASRFPEVTPSGVRTLTGQIEHCLGAMGIAPLAQDDPRLLALDAYLRWLSSGFPQQLGTSQPHSRAGGC
jgi:outer membrane protein assembly factor BamB